MKQVFIFAFYVLFSLPAFANEKVELYVLINADNDLITLDENEKMIHQGEIAFNQYLNIAKSFGENLVLHIFIDPNSLVSGPGFEKSRLVHCSNHECKEEMNIEIETDLTQAAPYQRLLSFRNFAEAKRVFIYWGHGNGLIPIPAFDYSEMKKSMSLAELAPILKPYSIDVLIFDACSMASLAVAKAFRESAAYIVASFFELPVEGLQTQAMLNMLVIITDDQSIEKSIFKTIAQETSSKYREIGYPFELVLFQTSQLTEESL